MANKPNIVLIFPDQQRADVMGCAGNSEIKTPNVDELAAQGITFNHCCTNSPLCVPARASLITGQYVNQHGVWNNNLYADNKGPSHVRNIRDAGYQTAVIGKTHLYVHDGETVDTRNHTQILKDWGYADIFELTGPWASARIGSPYTDYLADKGLLDIHREYIRHYLKGMRSGTMRPWEEPPSPLKPEDHLDTYTGRTAAKWISKYDNKKPFYLQVCFPGPHDPFDSPKEYRDMYKPQDMPIGIMDKPTWPVPPYVDFTMNWSALHGMTPEQKQMMRVFYYAKVTLIDHAIGMVTKALRDREMLDNTWIIYTSDHGEMLGDHFMSHKIVFYEGALKIPCIIRPPGGTKSWKSAGLTDQIDISATLLEIAGARPLEKSAGKSLMKKVIAGPLAGDAQTHKSAIFSEVKLFSMVLTDNWKMTVSSVSREPLELYDVKNDVNELDNRVRVPKQKIIRDELLQKYLNPLLDGMDQEKLKKYQNLGALTV